MSKVWSVWSSSVNSRFCRSHSGLFVRPLALFAPTRTPFGKRTRQKRFFDAFEGIALNRRNRAELRRVRLSEARPRPGRAQQARLRSGRKKCARHVPPVPGISLLFFSFFYFFQTIRKRHLEQREQCLEQMTFLLSHSLSDRKCLEHHFWFHVHSWNKVNEPLPDTTPVALG
jgi:hypothetical protein